MTEARRKVIFTTAIKLRAALVKKYPQGLMGKCIEATDLLVNKLNQMGFKAKAIQVWALYENFGYVTGSQPYEEHWICRVDSSKSGNKWVYIDVTMDQFQWAMYEKLPPVYIGEVCPNWLLRREPKRDTLNKCGWNDYWETGFYDSNFDYWSYTNRKEYKDLLKALSNISIDLGG